MTERVKGVVGRVRRKPADPDKPTFKQRLGAMPVIGRPVRAYGRYGDRDGNRMAAAVTYYGFFSLFPLLALGAAIAAALLSSGQIDRLKNKISENLPGLADKINIDTLVNNAGTVGLIGGVLLVIGGLGWVDATRWAIRRLWDKDPEPGNAVTRKLHDIVVLFGLGVTMIVSVATSSLATSVVKQTAQAVGLEHNAAGKVFLQVAGYAIGLSVSVALFLYLLVGLPGVTMKRSVALKGAITAAIGFEILKVLVASYIGKVAGKSMYGAFGVPIALLLWIYFVTRLLLFCAAWTATAEADRVAQDEAEGEREAQWIAGQEDAGDRKPAPGTNP